MRDFCFIHASDLHLDRPFSGVGPLPPELRPAIRDASLAAFDNLIELALTENAAFVLLSGDLYDGPERGLRAQRRLLAGLERLSARGIQTCIILGDEDQPGGWSAIDAWPAGVTIFGAAEVGSVTIERGGERLATVQGISYDRLHITDNPASHVHRPPGPGIAVAMLHTPLGDRPGRNGFIPCTVDELRARGIDYWALGHAHRAQIIQEANPAIVYPGTPQGRGTQPEERGPKGAFVVHVAGGRLQPPRFVPLDPVRCVSVELSISGLPDLPGLRRALLDRADELRAEQREPGLILDATLTGGGALHSEVLAEGAIEELLRELWLASKGLTPFVWWATLHDRTRPTGTTRGEEARLDGRRADFSAEVLGLAAELAAEPERRRTFTAERLAAGRLDVPDGAARDPEPGELAALLDQAATMALDLLEARDVDTRGTQGTQSIQGMETR